MCNKINRLVYYIRHDPYQILDYLTIWISPILPDIIFLKLYYFARWHKKLDLNNPKTFNEKLQWLKLYNRRPEYTVMVDKVDVKKMVASIIGDEYIIPTLGVYESFDEINLSELPNQFVIKCSHDSGGISICNNKLKFDAKTEGQKLNKALHSTFYNITREWPYKNVKPRLLVEKFMVDESGTELKDYKFFCFSGNIKFLKVDFNRSTKHQANYYDTEWNLLPFGEAALPPDPSRVINKPINFDKMVEIAEKLSKGIPFVRIDLYNVNGKIFFGEITFFPASGLGKFTSPEWDLKIGNLIKLPNK